MSFPIEWAKFVPKPRPLTSGDKYHVFLSYRSVNRAWVLNLYDVLRSGNASRDPVLQKGDVVYVPTAKKKPDLLSPLTTLLFLLPRL